MKRTIDSLCIALIGLPGSGKSHFKEIALNSFNNLKPLVPITTRKPRNNEIEGVSKFFVSEEEFEKMESDGNLFLVINVYSQKSGFLLSQLPNAHIYISEFYYKDVLELKKYFREVIYIYIKPQDMALLNRNLTERDEDNTEKERRSFSILQELIDIENMKSQHVFDYEIINDYSSSSEREFIRTIKHICENVSLKRRP